MIKGEDGQPQEYWLSLIRTWLVSLDKVAEKAIKEGELMVRLYLMLVVYSPRFSIFITIISILGSIKGGRKRESTMLNIFNRFVIVQVGGQIPEGKKPEPEVYIARAMLCSVRDSWNCTDRVR